MVEFTSLNKYLYTRTRVGRLVIILLLIWTKKLFSSSSVSTSMGLWRPACMDLVGSWPPGSPLPWCSGKAQPGSVWLNHLPEPPQLPKHFPNSPPCSTTLLLTAEFCRLFLPPWLPHPLPFTSACPAPLGARISGTEHDAPGQAGMEFIFSEQPIRC